MLALLLPLAGGCAPLATTGAPVAPVRAIALLPVDDVYGEGLPVRWASIAGLLGQAPPPLTVPDLLSGELRSRLEAVGFAVADSTTVRAKTAGAVPTSAADAARIARDSRRDEPVLYAKLSRWDADPGVSPTTITAKLDLVLVAPDGRTLWSANWPARPVPTGGAGSYAVASEMAVRWLVDEMTATLKPT